MRQSNFLSSSTKKGKKPGKSFIVIILCLMLGAGWFSYVAVMDVFGLSGSAEIMQVEILKGSSTDDIAKALHQSGIISYPMLFRLVVRSDADAEFKAGVYKLSSNMSYSQIIKNLSVPSTYNAGIKVTIPEGFESWLIAAELEKNGLTTKESFQNALDTHTFDFDFLKNINRTSFKLEGYLFPATYTFDNSMSDDDMIKHMLRKFESEFDSEMRSKAKEMNMSIDQVVTLASIIEREAKDEKDMPMVSSVFHNRLKNNSEYPRLESCATIQFLLKERKPILSDKDTQIKSPYNTYQNNGLPPGPICNPGRAALLAALNPADTPYYFFVLSKDGSHHIYSKTFDEHNRAVRENQ